MDEIVGELQCPICLEFLQHPLILPCAHVLCRNPCAVRLFNANFVRCPVCRDSSFVNGGVDSLPRVITLENIIDRYDVGFMYNLCRFTHFNIIRKLLLLERVHRVNYVLSLRQYIFDVIFVLHDVGIVTRHAPLH